ncbi:MAG: stage 0 sporulation protein [Clostridia bacterium]|nr:stage 0 sporulation protein [Clostridia bacterium]
MQVKEIIIKNNPYNRYIQNSDNYQKGDSVIVSVAGSLELGVVGNIVNCPDNEELVDFVRHATNDDKKAYCENCKFARSILPEIKKEADKLKLDMKISFVASNLDKSKLTINYTAEGRIDFRELVKILGSKFKARIEMKQIGNRDETKVVGALGVCGLQTCCKAFLSDFDKVSIKMAKNQNIALNPSRINGMCGRLLCCLKYEDEFYEEMQKKMPKPGYTATTPDGTGVVASSDFLKETVTVNFTKDDTTEVKVYDLKDISFKTKDK